MTNISEASHVVNVSRACQAAGIKDSGALVKINSGEVLKFRIKGLRGRPEQRGALFKDDRLLIFVLMATLNSNIAGLLKYITDY